MRFKHGRWPAFFLIAAMHATTGCMHGAPPCPESRDWKSIAPIPDALGVAGAFAGVSGGALLVAGGANFPDGMPWEGGKKAWCDAVYVLDGLRDVWRDAGRLPHPLAYGVSVQTDAGILCIGGNDHEGPRAETFLLSVKGHELQTRPFPPLPCPLANACGARVGELVFVAGGESKPLATQAESGLYCLDLKALDRGWQALPPWPGAARTLAAAAAINGEFYLVGGVSLIAGPDGKPARTYLKDGFAFNPKTGIWRQVADLPHPMAASPTPAPALDNKRFVILGGDDGSKYGFQPPEKHPGFCAESLVYHAVSDTWTVGKPIPAPRATLTAVTWRNRIVLPSGEQRPGVRSPEVWIFRPKEKCPK